MRIRTLAAVLVLIATGRTASADFLAIGSNPTTELAVPFGLASDGALDPSDRYQQVFASSLFRGPIVITALGFYTQGAGAGGAFNPVTFDFGLSTTNAAVGALNPKNLAANVGSDAVAFAAVSPTGSAPSTWTVGGSSSFVYDPSRGNLLLDIRMIGQTLNPGFLGASFDGQADYGGRSSSADNFGGNIAASGLSLGITFNAVPEPTSLVMLGVGGVLATLASRRASK